MVVVSSLYFDRTVDFFVFPSENYFEYDSVLFFEVWQQKPLNFNLNLFYFQLMVLSTRWLPRPDHLVEFPFVSMNY